jgi:very-short-patch-repair endonuclease
MLWQLLRDRRFAGIKFRRQVPVSRYVADFCCLDFRMIVELDGAVHESEAQRDHDENRDGYLEALGFRVLRFPNARILQTPEAVLTEILNAARALRPSLRSPSPGEGDGEAGEGARG